MGAVGTARTGTVGAAEVGAEGTAETSAVEVVGEVVVGIAVSAAILDSSGIFVNEHAE